MEMTSRSRMLTKTSKNEAKMSLAALLGGGPPLCRSVTCTFGAPSGTRTPNPLIKSQLLCQLS